MVLKQCHWLQKLHALITHGKLVPQTVDPLAQLAVYLAATLHDYNHGGYTNDYLINSSHDLAICYNDHAPLVSSSAQ